MTVWKPEDYGTAVGRPEYAKYMLDARRRWEENLTVTVQDVRNAYKHASSLIAQELANLPSTASVLRRSHLESLRDVVNTAFLQTNQRVLDAISKGINVSVTHGTSPAHRIARQTLGGVLEVRAIDAMFASVNEKALFATLNRSRGPKGLNLAESVWETTQQAQESIRKLVEAAVARGMDARQLAELVTPYLKPNQVNVKHRKATARRLGVRSDLPYPAMRLARTELAHAFHEATIMGNRALPTYKGIIWRLSQQHPLPDICDDLAQGQAYDGSGFWPKGQEPTRPHPQCMCHIVPQHQDLDDVVTDLQKWLTDPAAPEVQHIERWYQEEAKPFISLPPPVNPPPTPTATQPRTQAKPPEPKKPKRQPSLKQRVQARVAQGLNTAQDVIEVGAIIDEAVAVAREALREKKRRLLDTIDEATDRMTEIERQWGPRAINGPQEIEKEWRRLRTRMMEARWELERTNAELYSSERDAILETLKQVRDFGLPRGEKLRLNVAWNVPQVYVKRLNQAARFYPRKWLEYSQDHDTITLGRDGRGYYRYGRSGSRMGLDQRVGTPVHELAHRMEHIMPRIVDLERDFYRRRTKGDDWFDLYPENTKRGAEPELAKRDQWLHPYMGKEYWPKKEHPPGSGRWVMDHSGASGESVAYEILSMGMEMLFYGTHPGLLDDVRDREYRRFILGLLAGL